MRNAHNNPVRILSYRLLHKTEGQNMQNHNFTVVIHRTGRKQTEDV